MLFGEEDELVLFLDRAEAGRILGAKLIGYKHRPDVTVLALPPAFLSVLKWRRSCVRRSMCFWSVNWACLATLSWRWGRLRRVVFVS